MTTAAKRRLRRAGQELRRNLPEVMKTARKHSGGKLSDSRKAIAASVAKNLEALRALARE